jgi:hypothetical protein
MATCRKSRTTHMKSRYPEADRAASGYLLGHQEVVAATTWWLSILMNSGYASPVCLEECDQPSIGLSLPECFALTALGAAPPASTPTAGALGATRVLPTRTFPECRIAICQRRPDVFLSVVVAGGNVAGAYVSACAGHGDAERPGASRVARST